METQPEKNKRKSEYRPVIGIAIISLILCGIFFPLFITAIGQIFLPYQSNGSLVKLDGKTVGSQLIAQQFNATTFDQNAFFQPRNESASGVDPDITVQDAMSQVPAISNATGISVGQLQQLIDKNIDPEGTFVGLQYVNVLSLDIQLIQAYPSVYQSVG
jgi:potassium-transporting ATPase KdpC subunit